MSNYKGEHGTCPECGKDIAVTKADVIRQHRDTVGAPCAGGRGRPSDAPPRDTFSTVEIEEAVLEVLDDIAMSEAEIGYHDEPDGAHLTPLDVWGRVLSRLNPTTEESA